MFLLFFTVEYIMMFILFPYVSHTFIIYSKLTKNCKRLLYVFIRENIFRTTSPEELI